MRIGVISDSHGRVDCARRAVEMLDSCDVEQVLHCGDIGSLEIIPLFAAWPTHWVFGNVDDQRDALRRAISQQGHTCHGEFGSLELGGVRIALLHGDDLVRLRKTAESGDWDLVCYGHTHVARQDRSGKTLLLNPGALYRASPRSLALVELPECAATIIAL